MWTSKINQVHVAFWKQGKYKKALLIRQENHRLKMLTMTFQKSWFLSNRQEHVKKEEKKIPRSFKKKKQRIKYLLYVRTLPCKVTSVHIFWAGTPLQREHEVPLALHCAGNLWLWQMSSDWWLRLSHFRQSNILKKENHPNWSSLIK